MKSSVFLEIVRFVFFPHFSAKGHENIDFNSAFMS